MKLVVCSFCAGTVNQSAIGAALKAERVALDLKLLWFADEMQICESYLGYLEAGKRNWTARRYAQYRSILDREISAMTAKRREAYLKYCEEAKA